MNNICNQISDISVPERKALTESKALLQTEVTACETVLFDITHWIRAHRPPANVMAKVYVRQNHYETRRETLKEKIRQLEVLIEDFSDESYSFPIACQKLLESKNQPYNPRTKIYAELDALLKPESAKLKLIKSPKYTDITML